MTLIATKLVDYRAGMMLQDVDKYEDRFSKYNGYNLFKKQTESPTGILTPELQTDIMDSFNRPIGLSVINNRNVTIQTSRQDIGTITDQENTSQVVQLVFQTFAFPITQVPAQYKNNDIKKMQDFNRKLKQGIIAMGAAIDEACIATLEAERNQYFPPELSNIYPVQGNAFQISQSEASDFYNHAHSIMDEMDFAQFVDMYSVLGNTLHRPLVNRLQAQGAGNSNNENFQFDDLEFSYTKRIIPDSGNNIGSTTYMLPQDTVAMCPRYFPDNMMGRTIGGEMSGNNVPKDSWEMVTLPHLELMVEATYESGRADRTSLAGSLTSEFANAFVEVTQFSLDLCFVVTHNSSPTTTYSPVLKTEFSNL